MSGVLKLAVRKTIEACRGIEKAASIAGRSQSMAGLWNNLNVRDLPSIECALAMDAVALANGDSAHITAAMAADLGLSLIALPAESMSAECWNRLMADMSTEQADLLGGLLRDLADHKIRPREAQARRRDAQTLLGIIVEIDQRLRAIAEGGK